MGEARNTSDCTIQQWRPGAGSNRRPSDPRSSLLARSGRGSTAAVSVAAPRCRTGPSSAVSSSGGSFTITGVTHQSCSVSELAHRGHSSSRRRAARTANHSALSLRRSSACRRTLGCKAWTDQVAPSSSPRPTSSTPPISCMVIAHLLKDWMELHHLRQTYSQVMSGRVPPIGARPQPGSLVACANGAAARSRRPGRFEGRSS